MAKPTLEARVAALRTAVDASDGRLDPAVVSRAREVLQRAEERVQLSTEHTVVALAGATGAGKSTLFNALVGRPIARTGMQRPTTAFPMAVVAESTDIAAGSAALLDWLGVNDRAEIPIDKDHPDGLILLDLPDHDSVVAEHRMRADRVTERADLLIWVTNPQKYADGILHDEYLAALRGRDDTVVVVLNQIDRLGSAEVREVIADLKRLVRADGLEAKVIGASATHGDGIDDVHKLIARAVMRRETLRVSLTAEVRQAGAALLVGLPASVDASRDLKRARAVLLATLDDAAGVPIVVDAVRRSYVRDTMLHTGWPPLRWARKFRADPLRTIGLRAARPSSKGADVAPTELVRSSLPTASPAVRAQIASATRAYVAAASVALPSRAGEELNARAVATVEGIVGDLDQAITRTVQLRPARWWSVVGTPQWLFLAVAILGAAWLIVLGVLDYLRMPSAAFTPNLDILGTPVPWPTVLLLGGVIAGLVLSLLSRMLAGLGARRRAARTQRDLRAGVEQVATLKVLGEVDAELSLLSRAREASALAAA